MDYRKVEKRVEWTVAWMVSQVVVLKAAWKVEIVAEKMVVQ